MIDLFDMTIIYVFGILSGISLKYIYDHVTRWYSVRKIIREQEILNEKFAKEEDVKHKSELDSWLYWTVSGSVTREEMKKVLSKLYSEDRENLVFFVDFVRKHMKVQDISECVYLHSIGETLWHDIKFIVAIKEGFMPDSEKRIEVARDIENEYVEYVETTYGEYGENDLKLWFAFKELDGDF